MASNPVPERQFLVKLISAHLCKIISAGVKKHGVNQALRALHAQRLPGTYFLIQLQQAFLIVLGGILCKAGLNLRLVPEYLTDFIVGPNPQRTNQHGHRNLTGSVHTHIKDIVGIRLILQPRTPVGNHRTGIQLLSQLVMPYGVIDARGTYQLAYDDTLCSIDHESTGLCHQGKVAHENLMFADFFFFLIIEPYSHR